MSKQKKKLGLLACIATAIGATIGSGIFGSLTTAINNIGSATMYAFIAAAVYMLISLMPNAYASSVIPASGSFFLIPSKLIHPIAGIYIVCDYLLMPVLIASFAALFGDYFEILFPAAAGFGNIAGVALLAVFFVFAYRGNYILASVSSVLVALMIITILLYSGAGIACGNLSEGLKLAGGNGAITFSSFAVTVSLLASTLSGASSISQIADDIKNPSRDIPLTVVITPFIVALIYILMTLATLGNMPGETIDTLSQSAQQFLPNVLVNVFIIGGPILGITTSIIPTMMMTCATIKSASDTGLFPAFVSKTNKHGISPVILLYTTVFAAVLVLLDVPFSTLLLLFSTGSSLASIVNASLPFLIAKKYPHCAKHAGLKLNKIFVFVISGISMLVSAVLAFNALRSLGSSVWLKILFMFIAVFVYTFIRAKYLNKKGKHLFAELAAPYEAWENAEAHWAAVDNGEQ